MRSARPLLARRHAARSTAHSSHGTSTSADDPVRPASSRRAQAPRASLRGLRAAIGLGLVTGLALALVPSALGQDNCVQAQPLAGAGTTPWDDTLLTTSGFDGGGAPCHAVTGPTGPVERDAFFVWTATEDGDHRFEAQHGSGAPTRLDLHLGGNCGATCSASAEGTPASLVLSGLSAGDTYLVQVGVADPATPLGPGDLTIEVLGCELADDVREPDDTCAEARPLDTSPLPALTCLRDDPDFFALRVGPGVTLNAHLDHQVADADLDLFLYDAAGTCHDLPSGTQGALAYGYTSSDDEDLSWTNTTGAPVDCVLKVEVWVGSAGDCAPYTLQVTGGGAPQAFCAPAQPNSTGVGVTLADSWVGGATWLHLEAAGGPPGQFGYFLVSHAQVDPGTAVSDGLLCLAAPIGRYTVVAGPTLDSVGTFDAAGRLQSSTGNTLVGSGFDVPGVLPDPPGGLTPGESWAFQLWYRDGIASNFSDGLLVWN